MLRNILADGLRGSVCLLSVFGRRACGGIKLLFIRRATIVSSTVRRDEDNSDDGDRYE